MIEEKKKGWEQIRAKGFIRWWLNKSSIKFMLLVFVIIVFIINPMIIKIGLSYFTSHYFIKSIFLNSIIVIILSLVKAILTWSIIDAQYKRWTVQYLLYGFLISLNKYKNK